MLITILGFSLAGYFWSDFLCMRDLQKGNKSAFNPAARLFSGVVAVSLILQIVVHSGLVK